MFPKTIHDFITEQENSFQSDEIQIGDNWNWNFRNHIQLIFHLKNGKFYTGQNDWLRAFKEIMSPIIELANWTEDLELKDIVFFIENNDKRHLSFLIKKYHDEVYSREHNLDELFDEITEQDNAYGGVLIDVSQKKERPKAIKFTRIAFCDQTDIMAGPRGFKYYFSPSKLKSMEKNGWGKQENGAEGTIDDLILVADSTKDAEGARKGTKKNQTPGKNIEVYVVFGSLPESYLKEGDENTLVDQVQIVAFYNDAKKNRRDFTLYKKKAGEDSQLFFTSDEVEGRGLGRGVGEKTIHPQIWTNFLEINKMSLLEAASKVPMATDDDAFTERNKIQNMENLEITRVAEGRRIWQIPTAAPANIAVLQNAINTWFEHSQFLGVAFDPLMGKEPPSGTTFRGQERVVAQGKGAHDRKRGKRAKFIEKIYRDVIIPQIKKEILNGKEFLSTLSADEMVWVSERMADNYANKQITEDILNGQNPRDKDQLKEEFKLNFNKDSQHSIEILKDEFRDIEIRIGINIAGKQKDLRGLADKILSIIQFAFSNLPAFQQAMQIPAMSKALNDILEYSGISPADFNLAIQKPPQVQQKPQEVSPIQSPELNIPATV